MIIEIKTDFDIEVKVIKKAKSFDEYTRAIAGLELAKEILLDDMKRNTSKKITLDTDNYFQERQEVGSDDHTLSLVLFNRPYRTK